MDRDTEAAILEQEHRALRIFHNFFVRRKSWDKNDPRYKAVWKPLLFFFLSPGVVATGASIVAIVTLAVSIGSYKQLVIQNEEFIKQNAHLKKQIDQQTVALKLQKEQWDHQKRTELLSILYDGKPCEENPKRVCPTANLRTREYAVDTLSRLERNTERRLNLPYIYLSQANLDGINWISFDLI
jgi:hypothetical protein